MAVVRLPVFQLHQLEQVKDINIMLYFHLYSERTLRAH